MSDVLWRNKGKGCGGFSLVLQDHSSKLHMLPVPRVKQLQGESVTALWRSVARPRGPHDKETWRGGGRTHLLLACHLTIDTHPFRDGTPFSTPNRHLQRLARHGGRGGGGTLLLLTHHTVNVDRLSTPLQLETHFWGQNYLDLV